MSEMITSSSNSKIKLVRSLQSSSKNRKAESAFVAEGIRLIEEATSVNWPLEFLLYDESLSERGLALIKSLDGKPGADISEISPALMAEISDTETPQGILAVLKREAIPLPVSPSFVVIADQYFLIGPVFNMVRYGYYVQTFIPGFLDPLVWPNFSIGKNGMHVKITFQRFISHNIRDVDFISDLSR